MRETGDDNNMDGVGDYLYLRFLNPSNILVLTGVVTVQDSTQRYQPEARDTCAFYFLF